MATLWMAFGTAALAASSGPVPALSDAKSILEHLQKRYQQTSSFSAEFTEKVRPAGGTERERRGIIYYRKPGRMRWEFTGPERTTIISDGKNIYTYQPDLNQVIETPLAQAFSSTSAVSFLLGAGNVEQDFEASLPADLPHDGLVHVSLTPKAGGNTIETGLDPETYELRALKLTDSLGDTTELSFSAIRTGIALDDTLFEFKPPPGVDIVKTPRPGP